jgi:molecular chaperone DnaK
LTAVIGVGGQTITPYIREMVNAELDRADFRTDALTIVARGAALFASTRKLSSTPSTMVAAGMVDVRVAYSPVSPDLDAEVGIAVQPPVSGSRLTITRSDGGWSSGAIAIPSNGRVDVTVVLRAKKANAFQVEIRDAAGTLVRTGSDCGFNITHGLAVAKATTSQAFSVALEDNAIQIIIPRGTPLPAKGTQTFHTNREIVAGNPKSILPIYVVEGDHPRADRNRKVGEVTVRGNEIKRSLPLGETVEITYRLDESKNLSVEAVFSVLREPIAARYNAELIELDTEEIEIELQKERARLERIEQAAPDMVNTEASQQIVAIERVKDAAAAVGEHDAKQAAMNRLIELKKVLDALERSSSWEILVAKFESYRYDGDYIQAFGKPKQHADFLVALENAESALSSHDENALRDGLERMTDIYWDITRERDDFWKMQFTILNDDGQFVDPLRSEQLKEEGFRALKREDIGTLRTIVIELMDLQPSWQKGKLDMRFSDAGLRKL